AGPPPVQLEPPATLGAWTFWTTGQGLSTNVQDVSADEAGNVYVAGTDALYAKAKDAQFFLRFDAANAGLTQNCYQGVLADTPATHAQFSASINKKLHPAPPGPAIACPVISVAGAAPGLAAIGLQGIGTDGDNDADWAIDSGGMDLVKFDPVAGTAARTRHVFFASPPHYICGATGAESAGATSCPDVTDPIWVGGRRKLRQVFRIVVNHDTKSPMYGDIWAGGTHATFAALVNNAEQRGWVDIVKDQPDPKWQDAKDVWEHDHPGIAGAHGEFLTGYTYAMSIDPVTGRPWASNGFRTGWMENYGANVSSKLWWIGPTRPKPAKQWIDIWPDDADPQDGTNDSILSITHCPDRSVWVGSYTHALAHLDASGNVLGTAGLPDSATNGDSVSAVACDPSDGSLWIGLGWGGLMRLKDGQFSVPFPPGSGAPAFTSRAVKSIQIDRWSSPRVVYVAFQPKLDAAGNVTIPGGVASYDGP
ncbi:MAG TPA: hypothetical protein VI300_10995, partial [Solirubrobacter sp.]